MPGNAVTAGADYVSSGSRSSSARSASSQDAAVPQATSTNVDGWHPDPTFKGWTWNDLAFISVVFAPLLAFLGLEGAFAAAFQAIGRALSALWAAYGSLVAGLVTGGWRWLEKPALGSYGAFGRALRLLRGLLVNAWRTWSAFIEKLVAGLWRLLEKLESLYSKVEKCWAWLAPYLKAVMDKIRALIDAMTKLWNMLRLLKTIVDEISLYLWTHSRAYHEWDRIKWMLSNAGIRNSMFFSAILESIKGLMRAVAYLKERIDAWRKQHAS